MFGRLVAEHNAKKSFFTEVAGFEAAGMSQAQIEQALNTRKTAADTAKRKMTSITDLNLAAKTESSLCSMALMRLQHFGLASLTAWAQKENAALQSKPSIHR